MKSKNNLQPKSKEANKGRGETTTTALTQLSCSQLDKVSGGTYDPWIDGDEG